MSSEGKQTRNRRGPSKMPLGRHVVLEITEVGHPLVPAKASGPFKTACGVVARDAVPITYRAWTGRRGDLTVVPDDLKESYWRKVIEVFQFPPEKELLVRRHAITIMCNAWKNFKTFLNRDYVKKDLTPDFDKEYPKLRPFWEEFVEYKKLEIAQTIAQRNKANSDKNVYPHVLGTGGYVKKIPEWDKQEVELTASGVVPTTSELSTRSKHWMLARRATLSNDGSLTFRSERIEEVA